MNNEQLSNSTDEQLVKNICDFNQENYKFLVNRYQKKIHDYLFFLVKDDFLAKEATQEAFIKAFINLRSFNFNFKFSSWLFRIAHNETINLIVKNKNKVSLSNNIQLVDSMQADFGKNEVELNFLKKVEKKKIFQAINQLPFNYKEVIILYFFENKSYIEISDILRLNTRTIATHLNRAKKALKKILINKGDKYEK